MPCGYSSTSPASRAVSLLLKTWFAIRSWPRSCARTKRATIAPVRRANMAGSVGMALEDLLAQLSVDARWSAAELRQTPDGAIVQRGAARVLLVSADRVMAEPELVERAIHG